MNEPLDNIKSEYKTFNFSAYLFVSGALLWLLADSVDIFIYDFLRNFFLSRKSQMPYAMVFWMSVGITTFTFLALLFGLSKIYLNTRSLSKVIVLSIFSLLAVLLVQFRFHLILDFMELHIDYEVNQEYHDYVYSDNWNLKNNLSYLSKIVFGLISLIFISRSLTKKASAKSLHSQHHSPEV